MRVHVLWPRRHSSKIQADRYTYSTLLKISPWQRALVGMAQAEAGWENWKILEFIPPIFWTEADCDDRDAVMTGTMALVWHKSEYAWSSLTSVRGTG